MSGGTGLGIKTGGSPALAQSPGVMDGDQLSSAAAWRQIAAHGERLAAQGFHSLEQDQVKQQAAYYADKEVEAQRQFADLSNKHHDNPTAFDAEWKGFVDGSLSQAEPWAVDSLKKFYGGLGARGYSSALSTKRVKDEANERDSLNARLIMADNDVMGLAMAGKFKGLDGQDRPEWRAAQETYGKVIDSQVSLGLITPDEAKLKRDDLAGRIQSEMASQSTRKVFQDKGFDAAVEHARKDILENESLGLSPAARYKAFNRAVSDVRLMQAEQAQERQQIVQMSKDLIERFKADPSSVDPSEIKGVMEGLTRAGAAGEASRLASEAGIAGVKTFFRSVPLGEFGATLQSWKETGAHRPQIQGVIASAAQRYGLNPNLLNRVAHIESRFDPNAVNGDSGATGLFQFIPSTWKQYGAGADPRDPEANADAAARLMLANRDHLRSKLGREPTDGELYLAHQQGAGGAAKLLSDPSARAADIVGMRAVTLNGGTPDMTAGEFARLWVRKVEGPNATVAGSSSNSAIPPLPRVVRAAQEMFIQHAKDALPGVKAILERGEVPDADTYAAVQYAATLDPEIADDLKVVQASSAVAEQLPGMSAPQAQQALNDLEATFREGGLTIDENRVLVALEDQFKRQQKLAVEDPVAYAVQSTRERVSPPALDFSSVESLRAGFSHRAQLAHWTADSQQVPLGSPLNKAEAGQVEAALRGGNGPQAAMVLTALSSLPVGMMTAAMKDTGLKDVVLGLAASGDPAKMTAAYAFLDQEHKRDPLGFKARFGEETLKDLDVWNVMGRYLPPDQLTAWVKRKNDPSQQEARKPLVEAAHRILEKVTAADIVRAMDRVSWVPFTDPGMPISERPAEAPELLRSDFATLFREYYSELGDESKARDLALKRLSTVWSPSPANGGRLMRYAPEQQAVIDKTTGNLVSMSVDGSTDWIAKQLDADVKAVTGARDAEMAPVDPMGNVVAPPLQTLSDEDLRADRLYTAPRFLVTDRETESDILSRREPSYQVIIQTPEGRYQLLTAPNGRPYRFRPDRAPAQAEAEARFMAERAKRAKDAAMAAEAVRRAPPLHTLIDRDAITGEKAQ